MVAPPSSLDFFQIKTQIPSSKEIWRFSGGDGRSCKSNNWIQFQKINFAFIEAKLFSMQLENGDLLKSVALSA